MSYLWNASTYLIDKSKMDWQPGAAIAVALAFFVVFWMVYDGICQVFGRRKNGDTIVGVLIAIFIAFATWLACHWFAGRAAFLLVGAMMATTMSGNVFFWIIPGQRKSVKALREGKPVDPIHGQRGKQRSVHNTYFTLPVLFAMLSNHYSFTYTHKYNWIVLLLIMLGGAAIRQFFVVRHRFKLGNAGNPLRLRAGRRGGARPEHRVDAARAAGCPGGRRREQPRWLSATCRRCWSSAATCATAPALQMKNVRLDSPELATQHAQAIYQQVVVSKIMPMNNSTGITDAERALIGKWFQQGASTK